MRMTYLFSYWVFGWYLLYEARVIPYSPKLGLLLSLMVGIGVIALMIYYSHSWIRIFLVSMVMVVIKIIPLWTLRNTPLVPMDILTTGGALCVYLVWLSLFHQRWELVYDVRILQRNQSGDPVVSLLERYFIN